MNIQARPYRSLRPAHRRTHRRTRHTVLVLMSAAIAASTLGSLSGCAATQVAIAKRDLDVQTKMSASIFLDPVKLSQRTVYVQVRNTSDKPEFDVSVDLVQAVTAKGYQVVDDPDLAQFYLQANVLYVGKSSTTAAQALLSSGYGAPLTGAVTGLALVGALGNNPGGRALAGGAVGGGLVETVTGSFVKDVYYSVVTDVQIKQRLPQGRQAQLTSNHNLTQGTSGTENVTYSGSEDMKTYQTRVVSTANKVNLDFEEAQSPMRQGLVRSLSGLF